MTKILYIDESYEKNSKYIILAGFIIPISSWRELSTQIDQIKIKYFHTKNMNLKAIRRNKYDDHKYWEQLSDKEKKDFNDEFYSIISNDRYTILAGIIDREKMHEKGKALSFFLAYGFIIQRYQYYLSPLSQYGLVVMDSANNSKEVENLYKNHRTFLTEGIPTEKNEYTFKVGDKTILGKDYKRSPISNICENLIFMDDNDNNVLQIVDMVAAALSAYYNRKKDCYYNKIKNNIRCSKDGKINGFGIKMFPS